MMTPREYNAVTIASIFVLALILFMLATTPAHAQVRYGMLGEQPHTLLAEAYRPDSVKPAGFCIGRDVFRRPVGVDPRDSFVIVQSIVRAFVTGVDTTMAVDSTGRDTTWQVSERFMCPRGAMSIHFHGFGNCNPSRTDFESLLEEGTEFSVIYCGHARFYWREEAQALLRPPLQVRRASRGQPRANAPLSSEREHRRWLRAQLVGSAAGIVGIFDPDPSLWTDPDPWLSRDKAEHFIAGGNLYALCRVAGAGAAESVGCGVLASVFWEVGQSVRSPRRFISLKDVAVGVTGAAAGWLAEKALERFR